MSEVASRQDQNGAADQISVQELACRADQAMVTGDYTGCVALVVDIYKLLDRQTRSPLSAEDMQ
ncbi:MAG: hypothetical protein NVSMB18_19470 [Acetobacteraceae bacterium]